MADQFIRKQPRRIAPRLASGDSRERVYAAWPDEIKAGLFAIAATENKSVNWVIEEVIIDYFRLQRPHYKGEPEPKPKSKVHHMKRRGKAVA